MGGYRTQQHRLVHRGRSFHFVSYEGHPADLKRLQPETPASWYLMLAGKRWLVSPQVGDATPTELDRQFAEWLDAHVFSESAAVQSQQPPSPVAAPAAGGTAPHGTTRGMIGLLVLVMAFALWATAASAQTVTVVRNVNLRPDPSSEYPPIRLLKSSEPPLTLLDPTPEAGYYHVATSTGDSGYVWSRFVRVTAVPSATAATIQLGPGVPGSESMVGCGDSLWMHVYHPSRLLVKQDCLTVTGTLVDATADQAVHQPDGVRHEADGDTHGWLKVDPQFATLINAGNTSDEEGNLVFEIVCHFPVTQADAKPACVGFADHTTIPRVGSHVAITGTFVQEKNHKQWNEIHPVSHIAVESVAVNWRAPRPAADARVVRHLVRSRASPGGSRPSPG